MKKLIKMALVEDVGSGDITTKLITTNCQLPTTNKARIIVKENGVVAGMQLARMVFSVLDKRVRFVSKVKDGKFVKKGTVIAELSGPAGSILTGERLALNFLQHLSGIATLTNKFKTQILKLKTKVEILDTRKTTPLWRKAEKDAVLCGGGINHRFGLYDAILVKDNHIKIAKGIKKAIERSEERGVSREEIEVECKVISQVKQAIAAGVGRILLDNMSIATLKKAVGLCKKAKIKTEASGGVNLKNVAAIAKTGVDYISIGALTHSAPALDISLKVI